MRSQVDRILARLDQREEQKEADSAQEEETELQISMDDLGEGAQQDDEEPHELSAEVVKIKPLQFSNWRPPSGVKFVKLDVPKLVDARSIQ